MRDRTVADKLKEKLGIEVKDTKVDRPEMTPEIEALLREFGLLDEEDSLSEDAEA